MFQNISCCPGKAWKRTLIENLRRWVELHYSKAAQDQIPRKSSVRDRVTASWDQAFLMTSGQVLAGSQGKGACYPKSCIINVTMWATETGRRPQIIMHRCLYRERSVRRNHSRTTNPGGRETPARNESSKLAWWLTFLL
jgi:hypothetical protein